MLAAGFAAADARAGAAFLVAVAVDFAGAERAADLGAADFDAVDFDAPGLAPEDFAGDFAAAFLVRAELLVLDVATVVSFQKITSGQ